MSSDYGQHWTLTGLQYLVVNAIVITQGKIIAGTGLGSGNSTDGIYMSSDNGVSWTMIHNGIPDQTTVFSLVVKGTDVFAGTDEGIYRSTNAGSSWTLTSNGFPVYDYAQSLATNGSDIFVGTTRGSGGMGVYKSSDNGANWTAANNGIPYNASSAEYAKIFSLACVGATVYAGTAVGLYSSENNAASWTAVDLGVTSGTEGVTNKSIAAFGTGLFIGTGYDYHTRGIGIFLSTDTGQNWLSVGVNNTEITSLAACGPAVFAGTDLAGALYTTLNSGANWEFTNESLGDTYLKAMTVNGSAVFAGTMNNGIFVSTNYGQSWTQVNQGLSNIYITSLASGGNNVYAGTADGKVFVTGNNGSNWTEIGNGLIGVWALAIEGGHIYAGTDDGVYGSADNGLHWTALNANIEHTRILSLAIVGEMVLAGTENDNIYISSNNGGFWSMASGMGPSCDVYSIVASGSSIFAGTDPDGVFQSTNNGNNWTKVNTGLTFKNVRALAIDGTNIYAGTFGAGVWARSLGELVNINEPGADNGYVNIYPNPAKDKLTIELPNYENTEIEILSMDGRILQYISLQSPENQIDVKNLARGVYALRIINKNGYVVRKLIKQ